MSLENYNRLLIKLGSSAVTNDKGLDDLSIQKILSDIVYLKSKNKEVILVSSGAISCGKHYLKNYVSNRIHFQQAAAAIGQPLLFSKFLEILNKKNYQAAQVLVTHQDFRNKKSYFNTKNTLETLLKENTIPIINENDTISFDEITLGDNDQLAASVAELMEVDLVVYLSSSDGIYKNAKEKLDRIENANDLKNIKFDKKTSQGRGGIKTKLDAIKKLLSLHIDVKVGSYKKENPILSLGDLSSGSHCFSKKVHFSLRKKKILGHVKSGAYIQVDEGAMNALYKNASLLPSGISRIKGNFQRGDSIELRFARKIIGCGIVEYSSKEIDQIKGLKSKDISKALGYHLSDNVIHKDYLIVENK